MALNCFMFFTVWGLLRLPVFTAESKCRSELTSSINVTTELQSDLLLPCIFEPTLLGSNRTADVAAVWSQRDETVDNVVEIRLQGGERFWSNRGGRIKAFPKLSESGNFSILLRNVQRSDQGLYRCELYEGIDCSIAYQELHLTSTEPDADGFQSWSVTAGVFGGGIILLSLVIISCFFVKRGRNSRDKKVCKYTLDNPIYDTYLQPQQNSSPPAEEGVSPDLPVYAVIKKGKRTAKARNQIEEVL